MHVLNSSLWWWRRWWRSMWVMPRRWAVVPAVVPAVADDDGDRVEAGGADRDVEVGSHCHGIRLAVGGVFATETRLDGGGGGGKYSSGGTAPISVSINRKLNQFSSRR